MSDDLKTLVAQEVAKQLAAITADQTTKKVLEFLKNRNSAEAYVVETWSDGAQWYRRYSDGFIEQGGVIADISSSQIETVTFHTSFSNTNYVFNLSKQISDTGSSFSARAVGDINSDKSTSSVKIFHWGVVTNLTWFACGY